MDNENKDINNNTEGINDYFFKVNSNSQETATDENSNQPSSDFTQAPSQDKKYNDVFSNNEPDVPYIDAQPFENKAKAPDNIPNDTGVYSSVYQDPNPIYSDNPYKQGSYTQGADAQGAYQSSSSPYQQQAPYQSVQQSEPFDQPKSNKKGFKIFVSCIALLLTFAIGVCSALVIGNYKNNEKSTSESATKGKNDVDFELSKTPSSSNNKSNASGLSAAEINEKCRQSNVGILVYAQSANKMTTSANASGEGSGIVMGIDKNGKYTYVITCAHVIDDSNIKVSVQTEDGTTYDAEIVGYDTKTDLGVLKVETNKLVPAEFGNSDNLTIGENVYAIGNPGGVDFFGSFTGGYVSAINRPVNSEIGYTMKCIQHDAAINPGNSGGMLVNQYGQVIGINSQKIASSSYEGMGFAIPITAAKEIIDNLIDYGYVPNRPMLGITYYSVTASSQYNMIARIKGLPAGTLIINSISENSGLANTKARKYDMIIAVNGKDLDTADVLLEMIDNGKVGDKLTLTLCRVNSNYSLEEFDVECKLVEDKGEAMTEEETTQSYVDPFEEFYKQFGYDF